MKGLKGSASVPRSQNRMRAPGTREMTLCGGVSFSGVHHRWKKAVQVGVGPPGRNGYVGLTVRTEDMRLPNTTRAVF